MKTRSILLFTASVATMSSVLTADSDNVAAFPTTTPVIAVATAALPVTEKIQSRPIAPATAVAVVPTSDAIAPAAALADLGALEAVVRDITEKAETAAVTQASAVTVEPGIAVGSAGAPLADSTPLVTALTADAVAPTADIMSAPAVGVVMPDVPDIAVALVSVAITDIAPVVEPVLATSLPVLAPLETAAVTLSLATDTVPQPAGSMVVLETALAVPEPAAQAVIAPASAAQVVAAQPPAASPEMAQPQNAVPEIVVSQGVAEPAAGTINLPDAPQYTFFADAAPAPVVAVAVQAATEYSGAVSLEQAIAAALETSPEINQAIMNKEAIEFEREQAQGLYLPRVDIEASAGIRRLENPTRRTLGIEEDVLYPLEAGITAEQTVLDFGRRHGELLRQAARTDGAALRVAERSENTALLVSRQYLDILLQQRIVAAADDNVTFHRNLVNDLGQGVTQGSISIADQQQAQERLQAAVVRKAESEESLINAQIQLQTLTGLSIGGASMPQSLKASVSPTLGEAVAEARQNNPKVKEAVADVDAAHAMVEKANGDLYPTVGVEARGRVGEDIDGFDGKTNDVQARVVLRWNIFDGGINRAKVQEMVRRSSEARFRLHELGRFAEEDVRRAWNSMSTQRKIEQELQTQSRVSDDLLLSYREQFNVGRRSLLDVLDAQNTRYNVQVRLETSRFSEQFAEYQVLAATNKLLATLGLATPTAATSDARGRFDYGPPAPAELQRRRYPR